MDLKLENKVVLITGSGQGLGKGIAERFLSEGASIILTDIQAKRLESAKLDLQNKFEDAKIFTFRGNLTQNKDISECIKSSIKNFGRIDILVANLGSGRSIPDWNPSDDEWKRVMELNFEGARKMTNIVVPYMIEQGQGNIVYISSIAGKEVIGAPVAYSVAKASVIAYSKNLSVKLAPMGIRVNTVSPGNIFFEGGDWDSKTKQDKHKVISMLESTVPLKRFTSPEEIADLVLYLSSDKAAFITGSNITIDGGQTVAI
jgi:3-oxoacyl-[acyl-carrier protein] reductase